MLANRAKVLIIGLVALLQCGVSLGLSSTVYAAGTTSTTTTTSSGGTTTGSTTTTGTTSTGTTTSSNTDSTSSSTTSICDGANFYGVPDPTCTSVYKGWSNDTELNECSSTDSSGCDFDLNAQYGNYKSGVKGNLNSIDKGKLQYLIDAKMRQLDRDFQDVERYTLLLANPDVQGKSQFFTKSNTGATQFSSTSVNEWKACSDTITVTGHGCAGLMNGSQIHDAITTAEIAVNTEFAQINKISALLGSEGSFWSSESAQIKGVNDMDKALTVASPPNCTNPWLQTYPPKNTSMSLEEQTIGQPYIAPAPSDADACNKSYNDVNGSTGTSLKSFATDYLNFYSPTGKYNIDKLVPLSATAQKDQCGKASGLSAFNPVLQISLAICGLVVFGQNLLNSSLQTSTTLLFAAAHIGGASCADANNSTASTDSGYTTSLGTLAIPSDLCTPIQQLIDDTTGAHAASGQAVRKAYDVILTILNVLLIAGLILISLANILQIQVNTYGIKKILPGMLIGFIVAHFSMFLIKGALEISDQVSGKFTSIANDKAGPSYVSGDMSQMISVFSSVGSDANNDHPVLTLQTDPETPDPAKVFQQFVLNTFIGIAAVLVSILAFLFIIRNIIFFFLIPLAPIAFFGAFFPPLKFAWDRWKKTFTSWVFMPVVAMFWIWLMFAWFKAVNVGNGQPGIFGYLMAYIFGVVALWFAIKTPFSMAGEASKVVDKWNALGKSGFAMTGLPGQYGMVRDAVKNRGAEVLKSRTNTGFLGSRAMRLSNVINENAGSLKYERENKEKGYATDAKEFWRVDPRRKDKDGNPLTAAWYSAQGIRDRRNNLLNRIRTSGVGARGQDNVDRDILETARANKVSEGDNEFKAGRRNALLKNKSGEGTVKGLYGEESLADVEAATHLLKHQTEEMEDINKNIIKSKENELRQTEEYSHKLHELHKEHLEQTIETGKSDLERLRHEQEHLWDGVDEFGNKKKSVIQELEAQEQALHDKTGLVEEATKNIIKGARGVELSKDQEYIQLRQEKIKHDYDAADGEFKAKTAFLDSIDPAYKNPDKSVLSDEEKDRRIKLVNQIVETKTLGTASDKQEQDIFKDRAAAREKEYVTIETLEALNGQVQADLDAKRPVNDRTLEQIAHYSRQLESIPNIDQATKDSYRTVAQGYTELVGRIKANPTDYDSHNQSLKKARDTFDKGAVSIRLGDERQKALRRRNRAEFNSAVKDDINNASDNGNYKDLINSNSSKYGRALAYYYSGRSAELSRDELANVVALHTLARNGKLDGTDYVAFGKTLKDLHKGDASTIKWDKEDEATRNEIMKVATTTLENADEGGKIGEMMTDSKFYSATDSVKRKMMTQYNAYSTDPNTKVDMEKHRWDARALGSVQLSFGSTIEPAEQTSESSNTEGGPTPTSSQPVTNPTSTDGSSPRVSEDEVYREDEEENGDD